MQEPAAAIEPIRQVAYMLLTTAVGAAITAAVLAFLARRATRGSRFVLVWKGVIGRSPSWQALVPLAVTLAFNATLGAFLSISSRGTLIDHANRALDSASWALLNYFVWASLAMYFYIVGWGRASAQNFQVFVTGGLIGGLLHYPMCLIATHVREVILAAATVEQLYQLEPTALAKLWLPIGLESVTAGILAAYYLGLGHSGGLLAQIYRYRYRLLTLLLVWLAFTFPGAYLSDTGSFRRNALAYDNVLLVWGSPLLAILIGLPAGTELFDRIVAPRLLSRDNLETPAD